MRKIDPKPHRSMMTCADMVTKAGAFYTSQQNITFQPRTVTVSAAMRRSR